MNLPPAGRRLPTRSSNNGSLLTDVPGDTEAYDVHVAQTLSNDKPVFQRLFGYWNEKRGDRALCRRADIDAIEIREIFPHIVLLSVAFDPFDCTFRAQGWEVERGYGYPLTNLRLSQIWPTQEAFVFFEYDRVANGSNCRFSQNLCRDGWLVVRKVSRLLCPLSNDGEKADAILGAEIFEDVNEH